MMMMMMMMMMNTMGSSEVRQATDAFAVILSGHVVAHLYQRGDYTWLEWQDGYWDDPNRPVLGLYFEDHPRKQVASALRVPPWFSNLLPEGKLREWVARDARVSPAREMMLIRRLGADLPGAVAVIPVPSPADPRWDPTQIVEYLPPPNVADARFRFSLAGLAPKFSMIQDGDRLTLPGRDQYGDWIVKLPDAVYPNVPENEFAIMTLASKCGIDVPRVELIHRDSLSQLPDTVWPAGQELAYAVARYDRSSNGRVHAEDLCQVRGFYPEDKYRGSFETVAALAYRGRDIESYREFLRRLFFSYAIGNGDMHLKNVSLLYRDGRVPSLSPAYDLVCTVPYVTDSVDDLGLKLNGSRRFERVSPTSFINLSEKMGVSESVTLSVIHEVSQNLMDSWSQVEPMFSSLPAHRTWLSSRLPDVCSRF